MRYLIAGEAIAWLPAFGWQQFRTQGVPIRSTTQQLDRAPSTISNELRSNAATYDGKLKYRASVAQLKAGLVAQLPETAKLIDDRTDKIPSLAKGHTPKLPD